MASPRGCVAADRHPGPLHSEQTPPPFPTAPYRNPNAAGRRDTREARERGRRPRQERCKRNGKHTLRGQRNAKRRFRGPRAAPWNWRVFEDDEPGRRQGTVGGPREHRGRDAVPKSRLPTCREDRQRPRLSAEIAVDDPMSRKWPCVCRRRLSHKVHVFRNTDNIVFFRWKRVTWVHGEISQTLPQDQAGLVTRQPGPLLRHPRPAVLGISVGPCAPRVGSTPVWGAVTCLPSLLRPMSPSDS